MMINDPDTSDAEIGEFLKSRRMNGDEGLAEAIENDARRLLAESAIVRLERYINAVPDLAALPIALDAAIDFSLRSLTRTPMPPEQAVHAMVRQYPQFAEQIRTAALLDRAIWSTQRLTGVTSEAGDEFELPRDIGPLAPQGRPRYQMTDRIGRGATGTVYRAVDRLLSESDHPAWVAVKILRVMPRSADAAMRSQVCEEATKARRIGHPNVVKVLDRGFTSDDIPYIVYELVDGTGLDAWISHRGSPLSDFDIAALVERIADGVQSAHAAGLIHCDLKPDNILVTRAGEPKITDFGSSLRLNQQLEEQGGGRRGNVAFMAPERYRQERGIGPASDIYSLGGLLYYLLTRQLPNGSNAIDVARNLDGAHGRTAAPRAADVRANVHPDLDAIASRALAPNPANRYVSADGLARDLRSVLEHRPLSWRPPRLRRRLALSIRRQPRLYAVAAVSLVLLLSGAVWTVRSLARAENERLMTQIEEQQARISSAKSAAKAMLDTLEQDYDNRINGEWLTILTLMESVCGPLFPLGARGTAEWDKRVDTAQAMLHEARKEGVGEAADSLFLESVLGYWLLRQARYDEAIEVLERNRDAWADRLPSNDGWLAQIEFMIACARLGRIEEKVGSGHADADQTAVLREIEEALSREVKFFDGAYRGNALHTTIVEHRVRVYNARLLNDAGKERDMKKRLKAIAVSIPIPR